MNKEEAENLANTLLGRYDQSQEIPPRGFTSTVAVYGRPVGNQILTREAAEGLLKQLQEHPERAVVMIEDVGYALKRAWIEEESVSRGRVLAEYERPETGDARNLREVKLFAVDITDGVQPLREDEE